MANTTVVRKILPSASNDGAEVSNIGDRYGAQIVQPLHGKKQALAELGTYFVATNPVPGTPIAMSVSIQTFAETAGAVGVVLWMRNTETSAVNTSKRIYLDYLLLRPTTLVPTSATNWYAAGCIDYNATIATGASLIIPVNVNGDSSLASVSLLYFGINTTPVPSARRLVFNRLVRPVIPVLLDQYMFVFGGIEGNGSVLPGGTVVANISIAVPPVMLGPSQNFSLHMWGASMGAASATWEFEMGWWEK